MNSAPREPAEILLIDSDPYALSAAAGVLEEAGHVAYPARDRSAALSIARRQALDLVICDLLLTGDNGLDACRELRRLPGMQDVPVMFVSHSQLPDIVRRSHEAGGAYYLRKPLDLDLLVELVGKALWLPETTRRLSVRPAAAQLPPPPPHALRPRAAALQGIRLPLA